MFVYLCDTISRKNFPSSKVFCADVNDLLSLMVTGKTHEGARYVNDLRTGEIICQEGLPNPGDFDMITAGFPWCVPSIPPFFGSGTS